MLEWELTKKKELKRFTTLPSRLQSIIKPP